MNLHHFPHSAERAWERYGVSLSQRDYEALVEQCERRACFLRHDHDKEVQIVQHEGTAMVAVYERERNVILTILSKEMAKANVPKHRKPHKNRTYRPPGRIRGKARPKHPVDWVSEHA